IPTSTWEAEWSTIRYRIRLPCFSLTNHDRPSVARKYLRTNARKPHRIKNLPLILREYRAGTGRRRGNKVKHAFTHFHLCCRRNCPLFPFHLPPPPLQSRRICAKI
ncbi:hypothetical protein MPH_01873, partial [Macrophomina phaseolina MS6]